MIYPTSRAITLMVAGAPVALLIGLLQPGLWYVAIVWIAIVGALLLLDAASAVRTGAIGTRIDHPRAVGVGNAFALRLALAGPRIPQHAQVALRVDDRLAATGGLTAALRSGEREVEIPLSPTRRGKARIDRAWIRWRGPLGLVWMQRQEALDRSILITPDMRSVREEGIRLFLRDSLRGLMTRLDRGDGTEFEALTEFRAGMDRRAIDWKQSARHADLLAKEFRTERNNEIVFAIDSGRAMCEPVEGVPRVDRAVSAALLTAYIALKIGDRVGLLSFAARPKQASAMMSGARSFATLQRIAAEIDYSHDETNYTLALTTLAARLARRSLIVVFTDFTDPAGADLLVRAGARLLDRHVVVFVVIRDAELENAAAHPPETAADVSRAITAAALLRERRIVVTRLERLGIHVVDAPHDAIGPRLVDAYLMVKRRNLL